ncbi:MAG: small ribosomal subunit Rsm22 family protein [Chlamydiales bacterium]|nr:small ribosomal subunit Rsm22 family protein [Chlamydiales bacterium]
MSNIFLQIEELTRDVSLKSHYANLSRRYRTEQDKTLQNPQENLAYLACRMPATFAACCEVFKRLQEVAPHFVPTRVLDIGSGPATCMLALLEHYQSPEVFTLVEHDDAFIGYAKKFMMDNLAKCAWQYSPPDKGTYDLVTSSYMLSELSAEDQADMVTKMMNVNTSTIMLVDTGTPHGYNTLMKARSMLIENGYTILAPCPHNKPCPLQEPDWCHFSVRLARSRLHRQLKGGELGYEDEKFCYVIASKNIDRDRDYERILIPPVKRSGHAHLKLCMPDGTVQLTVVSKKMKDRYPQVKKAEWGDRL